MVDVVQTIVSGLIVGCVYALIALGMSLIFSMSRVINLAQGAFVVFAALAAVSVQKAAHLNPVLLMVVMAVIFAVVLAVVDVVVIRPGSKRAGRERMLLITVGLLQAIGGLLLVVWGNLPYTMASFSNKQSVTWGGVKLATQYFWIVGVLLISVAALWFLLQRTGLGLTMRATAQDPAAASLMGVNVDGVRLVAFSLAGAMAALAGTAIIPLTFLQYDTVVPYAVNGFIAAVIGGLGSSSGAVAGGLLLGVLEGVFSRYTASSTAEVLAIGLLILLLLVRPAGLRGKMSEVRR
ncbi:MAG TPA: branched-chain amino acid ABC transporter permease [Nocardioidaceae bacterium]|nr:branched-chain amino acid ABC transporter permease [Nocardioidaceae bacterium]